MKDTRPYYGQIKSRWYGMKARCYSTSLPKQTSKVYRDKGIHVCDEWLNSFDSFYVWSMSNGFRPGLSLDRIDSDGNYEPSNCQWISRQDNSKKAGYRTAETHPKPRGLYNVSRQIDGEIVHRFYTDKNGNKQRNF